MSWFDDATPGIKQFIVAHGLAVKKCGCQQNMDCLCLDKDEMDKIQAIAAVEIDEDAEMVMDRDRRQLADGCEWVVVLGTTGFPAVTSVLESKKDVPRLQSRHGQDRGAAEEARQALLAVHSVHSR